MEGQNGNSTIVKEIDERSGKDRESEGLIETVRKVTNAKLDAFGKKDSELIPKRILHCIFFSLPLSVLGHEVKLCVPPAGSSASFFC